LEPPEEDGQRFFTNKAYLFLGLPFVFERTDPAIDFLTTPYRPSLKTFDAAVALIFELTRTALDVAGFIAFFESLDIPYVIPCL
jgi:hypothetical protein